MNQQDKDQQFLTEVGRLEAEGLSLRDTAEALGIAPSTLTYRLARLGYGCRTCIADLRSGRPLREVVAEFSQEAEEVAA